MSYDLLVFDPTKAPSTAHDLEEWIGKQTRWEEEHSYDDPKVSTDRLREWFLAIVKAFPPMNGPYKLAEMPTDESSLTDYSIGRDVIFAGFAWSKSEAALKIVLELAEKHGLGVQDVSASSLKVWLPDKSGRLRLITPKSDQT